MLTTIKLDEAVTGPEQLSPKLGGGMGRLMLKTEGPGNVDVWSLKCVPISSSDDGVDSLFSSSEKRVVRKKNQ